MAVATAMFCEYSLSLSLCRSNFLLASGKEGSILKIMLAVPMHVSDLEISRLVGLLACSELTECHCNIICIEVMKVCSVFKKTA